MVLSAIKVAEGVCRSLVHPNGLKPLKWKEVCTPTNSTYVQFENDCYELPRNGVTRRRYDEANDGAISDF